MTEICEDMTRALKHRLSYVHKQKHLCSPRQQ